MNRTFEHLAAALVAVLLTTSTFIAVTAVPESPASNGAVASLVA